MDAIDLDGTVLEGLRVETLKSVLLMIKGRRGFLGCGYFDVDTANRLNEAVAVVTGVKTYDDMLVARVIRVSREAECLGIEPGMSGRDALARLA